MNKLHKWHKGLYKGAKKKYNLTGYQVAWISFGKGLLIGLLLL